MRPFCIHLAAMPLAIAFLTAAPAGAQQSSAGSAQARSKIIAAFFNKSKNKIKNKHGVREEKYVRVVSEPASRANPSDYSGSYRVHDFGLGLELRVNRDGSLEGSGYEPLSDNVRRNFVLRSGRIQGALLTATKVFADGATEPLEGAFINRSRFESPTDKGVTVFGLGTLSKPLTIAGNTMDKFFYEKMP